MRSEQSELLAAWRALSGHTAASGWRTISINSGGPCRLLAGRQFPDNREALLIGFMSVNAPASDQLPQGHGFLVSCEELGGEGDEDVWLALSRQPAGSLDLFALMADDVISTLEDLRAYADEQRLHIVLSRILAWQDFMRRRGDHVLEPETEIGLFGELEFLCELILTGLPVGEAVTAWRGPIGGIHDFAIGSGAFEVKTTVATDGFVAKISSLDQLDDALVRPLFLVALRLMVAPHGISLPEQIDRLRSLTTENPAAQSLLEGRLLHMGYLSASAARYTRRFISVSKRLLPVTDDFPRLTRSNVDSRIRQAVYEMELDSIATGHIGVQAALQQVRAIGEWN